MRHLLKDISSKLYQRRRELMLRVADGAKGVPPVLFFFNQFVRCDDMLKWCISRGYTGKRFEKWIQEEHKNSMLKAAEQIVMHLEGKKSERPILVGPDFTPGT